jgi:small GTP-binding protein
LANLQFLVGEERSIVSDVAGTTRDAIDTPVIREGQKFLFIDTAGMRRKARIDEPIEKYSIIRSLRAVDRSDVVLMVIDAIDGITEQDKKIIVPITDIESGTLSLSYINSMDDMKKGAYGILEPKTVRKADENNIDVILVPGLAFDRNGGRMGFGKGYYDRLLESSKAVKIGLCYDFQILEKIPTEIHDVPMNFVITEKEILEIR